ncbi:heparan-sulfate 6-O-sulfotransferase 1 isoform X3 [Monodon monoceros]|uniref:heparan-sulfate 6-O-sulfotransferase 1 isoform X3 n=1 Tax=Monodon monoceros TaxID=40151 RepID=UPI0010F8CD97|nr:heparan-sulfate 6-O-sulfotransferase 1 isoform X3 [Monodon monoceros]
MRRRRAGGRTMVERASKFVLVVAGSACFMLILYQYAGPGLSLGAPGGRAPPDDLDLFPTPDPHYEKKYYFPVRELERSLHFDMKGDDVIVFLHIQKTGGTTFGRHLVQNVRLEVPCDCRPGQKKCTCYRPNRRETWLFSRFSTGWSCGLHADWTELTNCVPGVLDRRDPAALRTPRSTYRSSGAGLGVMGPRRGVLLLRLSGEASLGSSSARFECGPGWKPPCCSPTVRGEGPCGLAALRVPGCLVSVPERQDCLRGSGGSVFRSTGARLHPGRGWWARGGAGTLSPAPPRPQAQLGPLSGSGWGGRGQLSPEDTLSHGFHWCRRMPWGPGSGGQGHGLEPAHVSPRWERAPPPRSCAQTVPTTGSSWSDAC